MPRQEYLNITTTQMYYFIEVVECKSYSLAAKNLYTSQSNLSKNVAALEKNLNVQLFIRTPKGLIPTQSGRYLYHKWKNHLLSMEKELNESRVLQGGYSHVISVGSLDSWLPQSCINVVLNRFAERYPACQINVYSYPVHELRKNLFNEALDLIFTVRYDFDEMSSEAVDMINLTRRPLYVCMQLDNPLALKEELTVSDLEGYSFVTIAPLYVPTYCSMTDRICSEAGFSPKYARYTNSALALPLNMIDKKDIFLCDQYYYDFGDSSFAFRPVKGIMSGITAVWRKEYEKPEIEFLIKLLNNVAQNQSCGQD